MNRFRQLLVELLKQDSFPLDAISFEEKIGSRNLVLYGAGEASHLFLEIITEIFGFKPILILDKKSISFK